MPRKKLPPSNRKVTAADKLIGQRLRTRRMELHASQAVLADKLGLTFQQVQKYENGSNRIGAVRLQQIANFLETDIAYFMGDMSNGKPRAPSKVSTFMATKDGIDIVEAMMKLDEPHRRSVIALARTLGNAYGEAKA
jgi:transcriptional regulator with XRE-family HTH domain